MRCRYRRRLWAGLGVGYVDAWGPAMAADPAVDVATDRGDAARTGVAPGPGPSRTPRVIRSFEPDVPIVSQVAVGMDLKG